MPYIGPAARKEYLYGDEKDFLVKAGNLNYAITQLLLHYAENMGHSYSTYNEIIGALECAKLEYYRRAVSCYENKKMEENGDVF